MLPWWCNTANVCTQWAGHWKCRSPPLCIHEWKRCSVKQNKNFPVQNRFFRCRRLPCSRIHIAGSLYTWLASKGSPHKSPRGSLDWPRGTAQRTSTHLMYQQNVPWWELDMDKGQIRADMNLNSENHKEVHSGTGTSLERRALHMQGKAGWIVLGFWQSMQQPPFHWCPLPSCYPTGTYCATLCKL